MEKIYIPEFISESVRPQPQSTCVLLVTCNYSCEGCYACESEGCGTCVACVGCEWHCEDCYSCQRCNTCQSCDSCNTCQGCDAAQGCGDRQGFPHLPTVTSVDLVKAGTNFLDISISAKNGYYYRAIARPMDSSHGDVDTGILTSSSIRISGLLVNRLYNVTAFAYNADQSEFHNMMVHFSTAPNGKLPTPTLSFIKATSTSASFSWGNVGRAQTVLIEINPAGVTSWENSVKLESPSNLSSVTINGLMANTNLVARAQGRAPYQTGWIDSSYSALVSFKTAQRPNLFRWDVSPGKGKPFSNTVTITKWIELQDTINAYRTIHQLTTYPISEDYNNKRVFTRPKQSGAIFHVGYFNQIISALTDLKSIGVIQTNIPALKASGEKCLATDFQQIEYCMENLFYS